MALVAAGGVVVVILAYFGIAVAAKLPPFKGTASPTPIAACPSGEHLQAGACVTPTGVPTATPSASPSPKPSPSPTSSLTPLAQVLPSYITGASSDSCQGETSAAYVATGESGGELCDMSQNGNVPEDYVLYAGFATEGPANAYFSSLVTANGMATGQGDCSSLDLATAADGSSQYCEGSYTTSSSSGSDFVFTGNVDFDLGNDNPISSLDVCAGEPSADVLGFTDPTYSAVGVAISCTGAEEDSALNDDFTSGDLFLGS